jgi:hypothetical protein
MRFPWKSQSKGHSDASIGGGHKWEQMWESGAAACTVSAASPLALEQRRQKCDLKAGVLGVLEPSVSSETPDHPAFLLGSSCTCRAGGWLPFKNLSPFVGFTSPPGVWTANYRRPQCICFPAEQRDCSGGKWFYPSSRSARALDPSSWSLSWNRLPGNQASNVCVWVEGVRSKGVLLLRGCGGEGGKVYSPTPR